MVPCPQCKGGCKLCMGNGEVTEGVAKIYEREETRSTTKLSTDYLHSLANRFQPEPITKPDVLKKAEQVRKIGFWILIMFLALAIGITLGMSVRYCGRM
jgi:hypothetical protein